jgi:uncharacterized protein
MAAKRTKTPASPPTESARAPTITMDEIRRLADEIAEKFHPEKIILFGSFAYGEPNEESDVDMLVVMPAANMISQCVRIRGKTSHPFPLDLIVRTPTYLQKRLELGDWFLREIVGKGKVLYESTDQGVDTEGGSRLASGKKNRRVPAKPK